MTKQELMENYTAEQLAEMVVKLENVPAIADYELKLLIMQRKNKQLQSEVEKYRKAFEYAKKERDCQIAEYRKKIKEMDDRAILEFPTEPIDVANFLINGLGASWHYDSFDVSELRQIAEHLLVYCNHNKEEEE